MAIQKITGGVIQDGAIVLADVVSGNNILSNVNVLSATYDNVLFSVAAQDTSPQGVFFSPDGYKMFILGNTGNDVTEYLLSTPWVVSSATYSTAFSVATQETTPTGIFFRADGLKMYVVGQISDTVSQYALTTPWSLDTASYESISFNILAQETTSTGIFFKPDGLSMYVIGSANDAVQQCTVSTAWNVSTATFLQSFSVSAQENGAQALSFTGDGTRLFVLGSTGDDINVYNLTTPWDISTASSIGAFSVAAQETGPSGLYVKPDGTKMYVVGGTGTVALPDDAVYQYSIPNIDIQLTGPTSVAALDVQQDLTVYGTLEFYSISVGGSVGTAGQFLQTNGVATAPSWVDAPTSTGSTLYLSQNFGGF